MDDAEFDSAPGRPSRRLRVAALLVVSLALCAVRPTAAAEQATPAPLLPWCVAGFESPPALIYATADEIAEINAAHDTLEPGDFARPWASFAPDPTNDSCATMDGVLRDDLRGSFMICRANRAGLLVPAETIPIYAQAAAGEVIADPNTGACPGGWAPDAATGEIPWRNSRAVCLVRATSGTEGNRLAFLANVPDAILARILASGPESSQRSTDWNWLPWSSVAYAGRPDLNGSCSTVDGRLMPYDPQEWVPLCVPRIDGERVPQFVLSRDAPYLRLPAADPTTGACEGGWQPVGSPGPWPTMVPPVVPTAAPVATQEAKG